MRDDLIKRSDVYKAVDDWLEGKVPNLNIKDIPSADRPIGEWIDRSDGGRIEDAPSIDIVRCQECSKSHIDGKTTHYLWCVEWGRSTDVFGYCEKGERE